MRRVLAVFGSAVFFFIAPGTVAGLGPWWISGWRFHPRDQWEIPSEIAGGLLIVAGLAVLLESFARFAWQGLGTPAPVFPTKHLVVKGLYRYVRNPMYLAVLSIVLGQALFFGNLQILEYAGAVWLGFHLFVLAYEEPTLRATFDQEYERFRANVPRWIPRFWPWNGPTYSEPPGPDSTVPRPRSSATGR